MAIRDEDLEELECHLLDTVDALTKNGLSPAEAFLIATHRIGHPADLEDQFGRAKPAVLWTERARWMVLGILSWWATASMARVFASLTLWLGTPLSTDGFLLGWVGLATQVCLSLGLCWVAITRIGGHRNTTSTAKPNAARPLASQWIIRLSIGTIILAITATSLQTLAFTTAGPTSQLGQYLVVSQWGTTALLPAVVILFGLWLARSGRWQSMPGALAAAAFALLLAGCTPPDSPAGNATPDTRAANLQSCLDLVRNDVNAAVDSFLDLDLSQDPLFPTGTALSFSEAEFANLPPTAREKIGQQALADVDLIKKLATGVKSRRDSAKANADTAGAERCKAQLARLGQRLSGPDNLKLTQLVGKAVTRMAAE